MLSAHRVLFMLSRCLYFFSRTGRKFVTMEAPTPAMSIPRHTGTPLVDIGINLGNKQYNNDRVAVVDRALSHGVGTMIITGTRGSPFPRVSSVFS